MSSELPNAKLAGNRRTWIQLLLFGIIGISNTVVDIIVYWLLIQLTVPYVIANIASYGAGMLNSYLLNKNITFRSNNNIQYERNVIIRFIIWNVITLTLSSGMIVVAVEWIALSQLWSKLIVTCFIVLIQFVGTKKWVFRQ